MKKFIVCALALLMLVFSFAALSEENAEDAKDGWYELSLNGEVLTVRLPGNTKSGLSWTFEISNPEALELLTMETVVGEEEGMAGSPTTFAASFIAIGNQARNTALILRCAADETEAAVYTRVLQLDISAENQIAVSSCQEISPFAQWVEMDEDGCVLTVRMPSADWSFDILDPGMVQLVTCDTSTGQFVASFIATMTEYGSTEIVLTLEDGRESRAVTLFVNESGMIFVERVDEFRILSAVDFVYCEECFGRFESAAFENHVCKEDENANAPAEFQTVIVTGSSVHMRAGAGTNAESMMLLKKGDNAEYLGETVTDASGMQWHKISFAEKTGWISAKYSKLTDSACENSEADESDMRLVYNPNRYDVLRVSSIFSQDGKTYYIDGCFGRINDGSEPEKFDERNTVRLLLNPGAEILLPLDPDDLSSVGYVDDPAAWYANICNTYGAGFKFYATFSMNESGAIRNLVYKHVD